MILFETDSKTSPIRVGINDFKGKKYLDIRKFYIPEGKTELAPTQKGVSMTEEQFIGIYQALKSNYDIIIKELSDAEEN